MATTARKNRVVIFLIAALVVGLAVIGFYKSIGDPSGGQPLALDWRLPWLVFISLFLYFAIRLFNALLFDFAFRLRRGFEAPTLLRNVFTLVIFAVLFALAFSKTYTNVNLGAIFTTTAI